MPTPIASRIYRHIAAAVLRHIHAVASYLQVRRWRRDALRALRQRSRD